MIQLSNKLTFIDRVSPGIYHNFDKHEGKKILSKSFLHGISENPFEWINKEPFTPTPSSIHGSLVDSMISDPDGWQSEFIISPHSAFQSAEAKKWKAEQEKSGKTIVKAAQVENAKIALLNLREFMRRNKITINDTKVTHLPQVALIAPYEVDCSRYLIKGLLDFFPVSSEQPIIDLKTTGINLNDEREIKRQIWKMGYHKQAGLYFWLYCRIKGEYPAGFSFLFQSNKNPYICRMVKMKDSEIRQGIRDFEKDMETYHSCQTSGEYPGAFLEELEGALPDWAMTDENTNEWEGEGE